MFVRQVLRSTAIFILLPVDTYGFVTSTAIREQSKKTVTTERTYWSEGGALSSERGLMRYSPGCLFATSKSSDIQGDSAKDSTWEDFERKNEIRRKYGAPPLTRQQYDEVQAKVMIMEQEQREKASNMASSLKSSRQKYNRGIFAGIFSDDECRSNDDCERPEVCCEVGGRKVCCSSGKRVYNDAGISELIPAVVTVPARSGAADFN